MNPKDRLRQVQADASTRMLIAALFITERKKKRGLIDLKVHHTGLIKRNDGTSWQWNAGTSG